MRSSVSVEAKSFLQTIVIAECVYLAYLDNFLYVGRMFVFIFKIKAVKQSLENINQHKSGYLE